MTEDEYNNWSGWVLRGLALALFILTLSVGCAATHRSQPDTLPAGDTGTIFDHAREYWKDRREAKEVLVEDRAIISSEESKEISYDAYNRGFSDAISKIKERCLGENWFLIDGIRYGCMSTKSVKGQDDYEFSTGQ